MCCVRVIQRENRSSFEPKTFKDKFLCERKNLYTYFWENLVQGNVSERRDSLNELWIRQ